MVTDNIDVSIIITTTDIGDETIIDGGTPSFTKDPISGGTP